MSDIASTPPAATATADTTEDKTVAIVAYLSLIGFIIALVIHQNKKTRLGAYHLRQCLGFFITAFALSFLMIIPVLGWIAAPLIGLCLFVLWILGLISAIKGEQKPVPLIGAHYQKWFGNTFD